MHERLVRCCTRIATRVELRGNWDHDFPAHGWIEIGDNRRFTPLSSTPLLLINVRAVINLYLFSIVHTVHRKFSNKMFEFKTNRSIGDD